MGKSNAKKSEQLGMPLGTASNRLRKSIMFSLVQEAKKDTCFQCKEKITDIANFSIEHMTPWLDSEDPTGNFFSLDNIAFSHTKCNYSAARQPTSVRRGGEALKKHIGKLGLIGVYYDKRRSNPYRARIKKDGKEHLIGYFYTKEEAAREVDKALISAYGKDIDTNKSLGLI
ncbi:helix-turn-helix protein [Bacillus phage Kioshi]|nr:helix-turn-helix protein [Bacillus phage Kioshi]